MAQEKGNPVLKAALEYHRRGWCIIPIPYGKKEARIRWSKYKQERPTEQQIDQCFSKGKSNIAVVLGKVSGGLTCLDFDEMQGYERWKRFNPDLAAKLPTVQTSRGMHVYFRSKLEKIKKMEKLDIKASGYCMLPPSLHPDGITIYCWLTVPNGQLPELLPKDLGIGDFTEEPDDRDDIEATIDVSIASSSSASSVSSIIVFENLDVTVKNYVSTAIKRTLPDKKGYRNSSIFKYCRWLKGHSEFTECQAKQLKPLVRLWHEKALRTIGTKPFDETWADFCYGWTRVKYPKGGGSLKIATQKAIDAQNTVVAEEIYEKPEVKLLVRICFELQTLQKTEPFWLSCGDAALILGISAPTAGKWFSMLEADGVIKKVAGHTAKRAARYKFIVKYEK